MIGQDMIKITLRNVIMNNKIPYITLLMSVFLLASCSGFDLLGARKMSGSNNSQGVSAQNGGANYSPYGDQDDSEFISYQETGADYRAFGERTPQDQNIIQSGAGSNMSAVVPPSVDNEMSGYEVEVTESVDEELPVSSTVDEEVSDYEVEIDDSKKEVASTTDVAEFAEEDPVEDWLAEEGSTLKGLLSDWTERSGWRLIWNTNRNYTLTPSNLK